jgi:hypothetical protein
VDGPHDGEIVLVLGGLLGQDRVLDHVFGDMVVMYGVNLLVVARHAG